MSGLQKEPWIMVRDAGRLKLLAREGNAFLLIWVNDALTLEKEEALIRRGSVSAPLLQESGLKFQTFVDVRGVALTGREAGDTVTLYLKKGKKKLMLEDDYTKASMDELFSGVERFIPQRPKKKKGGWRANGQDEKLYPFMLAIGIGVNLAAVILFSGYVITKNWLWFLGYLMVPVAAVFLDIRFPAYFSLINWFARRKKQTSDGAIDLGMALFFTMIVLGMLSSFDNMEWKLSLLWFILAEVLLSAVVLGRFAREFREEREYLAMLIIFCILGGSCLTIAANRAFCFDAPQLQTVQVETLDRSKDAFFCCITDGQGQERRVSISQSLYEQLEVGEAVEYRVYPGALGFPFWEIVPME